MQSKNFIDWRLQIDFIENYISMFAPPPKDYYSLMDKDFCKRSYANFAAKECLRYVKNHPTEYPLDSVDIFGRKMSEYSWMMNNKDLDVDFVNPFEIAVETVRDLYDQLSIYTDFSISKGEVLWQQKLNGK